MNFKDIFVLITNSDNIQTTLVHNKLIIKSLLNYQNEVNKVVNNKDDSLGEVK